MNELSIVLEWKQQSLFTKQTSLFDNPIFLPALPPSMQSNTEFLGAILNLVLLKGIFIPLS